MTVPEVPSKPAPASPTGPLVMLGLLSVAAFAGTSQMHDAYQEALREGYRFLSYFHPTPAKYPAGDNEIASRSRLG